MTKIIGAVRLIRPLNGVIAVLSLIPAVVLGSGHFRFPIGEAVASFFVASYGYAVNDLFDFRADRVNKPWRVIPSGALSAWQGINVALLCFVLGFVALAKSDIQVMLFFVAVSVALFFYAFKISSILVLSNVWVALLCSSAFVLGGLITSASPSNWNLLFAAVVLTFLYHLGREIVKDIQDIAGDRLAGRKTLPIVWGERNARLAATIVYLIMIIATYIIHFGFDLPKAFVIIVTFAVNVPIVVIFALLVLRTGGGNIRRASVALKLVMIPALIALVFAGLNRV